MAGFNAATVVEPLDYDLRPYVDAHGTIKEPTDKQIATFMAEVKKVITQAQEELPTNVNLDDPSAILAALDNLEPDKMVQVMGDMCSIYSALCSGHPTVKQFSDLPMRIRQVFFGWLQAEVMSPEVVSGGGNGGPTTPPLQAIG